MKDKFNDRLQKVQIGRENDLPLDTNKKLWFLVIYKSGKWDAENNLFCFKEDIEKSLIENIFCVWNGQWNTNLFLMKQSFVLNYLKNKLKK